MTTFIIDFKDTASDLDIQNYLTLHGCTTVLTYDAFSKVYLVESNVTPASTSITSSIINNDSTVITMQSVVSVQPRQFVTTTISNASTNDWWKYYSLDGIDLSAPTCDINLKSAADGVVVYLLDSGIDQAHPEFVGQNIQLLSSITPNDYTDTTGHGTAMASLITGNTCSITSVPVKIVKIHDINVPLRVSDMLVALNSIITDIMTNGVTFPIINMSWSISRNLYIEEKIQLLINMGCAISVAAGNQGRPIENTTPAAMKDVITVGAYDNNLLPSPFSNFGGLPTTVDGVLVAGELDIWAPGTQIYIAKPGGTYGIGDGTSHAAALVTQSLAYATPGSTTMSSALKRLAPITGSIRAVTLIKECSRNGLLDLSDAKYANSNNTSLKFTNIHQIKNAEVFPADITVYLRPGDTSRLIIFNRMSTTSVEVVDILPDWVFMSDESLIISPTTLVNKSAGVDTIVLTFNITTLTTVVTKVVTINVVTDNYDIASVPDSGNILKYTVSTNVCRWIGGCLGGTCGTRTCCSGNTKLTCGCIASC